MLLYNDPFSMAATQRDGIELRGTGGSDVKTTKAGSVMLGDSGKLEWMSHTPDPLRN